MKKKTIQEFIKEAKECHEIDYDYSKTEYKGIHEKVCIICSEHGEFWQEAGVHLKGGHCPKCPQQYSQKRFLENANKIHNNYYDYSKVKYVKMHDKVCIICPEHGEFWQKPYKHLQGQGCSVCGQIKANQNKNKSIISKGESFIKTWLEQNRIPFSWQKPIITEHFARNSNTMYVDFYIEIEDKCYVIEYNGIQHYKFSNFFYKTQEEFEAQRRRDKLLKKYCQLNDITLIELKYTLSLDKIENILKQMFKISFDFDETTKKISNIKVVSEEIKEVDMSNPTMLVLDNKLKFSDSAIQLLNAKANDRIAINYWMVNNEETFPVVGKSEVFTDPDGGNRLTQTNTVSFRGRQRETLLVYGDQFTLEAFKDGMFKLVSVKSINDETQVINDAQKDLEIVQDVLEEEIFDETFDFDDLPF